MNETQRVLEFNKIKEKLNELAYTQYAKDIISELKPFMSETEVNRKLKDTSEAKLMLEKCGNAPATTLEGISDIFTIAQKGDCLSATQLEQVEITLTAIKRLKDYLCRCKQYEISLPYYEENLDWLEDIHTEISLLIRNGAVDDYATKLLKSLRDNIERTDRKMRDKADSVIKANKDYMSDSFSTIRNGHICIPVKRDYKFKISGSVIDKSSTGNTLFIEPVSVAKYYDELQGLKIDEENEVRRILYTLTAMLYDKEEVMHQNTQIIGQLDFIFAKAKLSVAYDGVEPKINTNRYIKLENSRHPLMDKDINVPLNFEIGNGINGIVITGPNTGGKTVAIKTVALNCMMAQCGLHVASKKADICMNDLILCDIGDGQNLSENLSTFSAHIKNVLNILKHANKESLVIMDELGSGTDPTEGMGIAISILDELKKCGALYLITTHYPEVKTYVSYESGVINAKMTFDKDTLQPLYQLVIGEAGESCAFYIAQKLGMPGSMLKTAAIAAYGSDAIDSTFMQEISLDTSDELIHKKQTFIHKAKKPSTSPNLSQKFHRGDSVMVLPDKKLGIVCEPINSKGLLCVQMPDKKIWINHKRVKLQVSANELYPEDYDFSIIFDSVEVRKARHQMERKYVDGSIIYED